MLLLEHSPALTALEVAADMANRTVAKETFMVVFVSDDEDVLEGRVWIL